MTRFRARERDLVDIAAVETRGGVEREVRVRLPDVGVPVDALHERAAIRGDEHDLDARVGGREPGAHLVAGVESEGVRHRGAGEGGGRVEARALVRAREPEEVVGHGEIVRRAHDDAAADAATGGTRGAAGVTAACARRKRPRERAREGSDRGRHDAERPGEQPLTGFSNPTPFRFNLDGTAVPFDAERERARARDGREYRPRRTDGVVRTRRSAPCALREVAPAVGAPCCARHARGRGADNADCSTLFGARGADFLEKLAKAPPRRDPIAPRKNLWTRRVAERVRAQRLD